MLDEQRILSKLDELAHAVRGLEVAILGNGTRGLADRVTSLEESLAVLEDARQRAYWPQRIIALVVTAGISAGVATIIGRV